MTPSSAQFLPNQLNFGKIKGKKIIANFSGGRITSDAGGFLALPIAFGVRKAGDYG